MTAFMFFSNTNRARIKTENSAATFGELGKLTGDEWRGLGSDDKQKYEKMKVDDQQRYVEEMAVYSASQEANMTAAAAVPSAVAAAPAAAKEEPVGGAGVPQASPCKSNVSVKKVKTVKKDFFAKKAVSAKPKVTKEKPLGSEADGSDAAVPRRAAKPGVVLNERSVLRRVEAKRSGKEYINQRVAMADGKTVLEVRY
jgi:hypothetical protein